MHHLPSKKNMFIGAALGIGLVATGTAAYLFYFSDDAEARRKKFMKKIEEFKSRMGDKVELIKDLHDDAYDTMRQKLSEKISNLRDAAPHEIAKVMVELRSFRDEIEHEITELEKTDKKTSRSW